VAFLLILAGFFLGGLTPAWLAQRGFTLSLIRCHMYCCLGACLLLAGVAASSSVQRWLSLSPFVFLGKISFPLYLLHLPVLYSAGAGLYCLLHASLGRVASSLIAATVTLAISLLLGWLGSLTLEPFAIWSGRVVANWLSESRVCSQETPATATKIAA
jgi:peptidoglycan/LPS O-acetylase OafA/YrhL